MAINLLLAIIDGRFPPGAVRVNSSAVDEEKLWAVLGYIGDILYFQSFADLQQLIF